MNKPIAFKGAMWEFRNSGYHPSTLRSFLNRGQSKQLVKGCPVLEVDGDQFILKNGLFWDNEKFENHSSSAVLAEGQNGKVLLLNGDEDNDNSIDITSEGFEGVSKITISFLCIGRMLNIKAVEVQQLLGSGKIQLLDYTADSMKEPSVKIKKKAKLIIQKWNNNEIDRNKMQMDLASIGRGNFGFTLIHAGGSKIMWHRSATIVFKYKDDFYVMGQDDGSYFMCLLPKMSVRTLTVFQALKSLAPEGVNSKSIRQGEWFFVPVKNNDVPLDYECELFSDDNSNMYLPIDDLDSNRHEIECDQFKMSCGVLYVYNFRVMHIQHPELSGKEWYKVLKNTARRSVSQAGVD